MTELTTASFRGRDGVFADTPLEALHRIRVPTLVLTGAGDGHNATARALADALPNGQYIELPGDHGSAITAPQFEAAIVSFLGGGAAAGPPPGRGPVSPVPFLH